MTFDGRELAGARAVVFGAGFLGSNLVRGLCDAGADVLAFDRFEPSHTDGAEWVAGDITDEVAVRSAVRGADHVFAFAGGLGALRSLTDPLSDLRSSVQAQVVLLEAVRELAPAASVVLPGSRLEYGHPQHLPVGEDHPLRGGSPYAIHKTACAQLYRFYAETHGLHAVVLRLPNPYGAHTPGASARTGYGVLNGFIDTALAAGTIALYGGGEQLRDFVHVDDAVVAALRAALEPRAAGLAINIGSGQGVSLRRAAELVVEACGSGTIDAEVPWPADAEAVETGDFYFDVSLAERVLGWRPSVPLSEGIARVVDTERGVARAAS